MSSSPYVLLYLFKTIFDVCTYSPWIGNLEERLLTAMIVKVIFRPSDQWLSSLTNLSDLIQTIFLVYMLREGQTTKEH